MLKMRTHWQQFLLVLVVSLIVEPAAWTQANTSMPSNLTGTSPRGVVDDALDSWESVGLSTEVVSILAIDPQTPTTLYAGTNTGVYKSTNGGGNWTNIGLNSYHIISLAIDPVTPTILYAGTYYGGGGVYKTTTGEGNWTAANTGLTNFGINALAIDPQTPSTLYVATDGGGVFKSTNSGGNWTSASAGITDPLVRRLTIDPQNPSTLYAGTWYGGVFKSMNGGGNWSAINVGFPSYSVDFLAIDPQTPSTIYMGTLNGGAFKSPDSGGNWSAINEGLPGTNVTAVVFDSESSATVYSSVNGGGVFKSTNGGGNWSTFNTGLTNTNLLYLVSDLQTPATLYAGTNGGGVFAYELPDEIIGLRATKGVSLPSASLGSSLTYTITLTNIITDDLGVAVTDTLPADVSYIAGSLAAPSGVYTYTGGVIRWDGTVNAGESLTITFGAVVTETASLGDLVNMAVISSGEQTITRTATTTIINPLASSTKSVDQSTTAMGNSLIYTITLNNASAIDLAGVIVTDTLPAGLSYVGDSLTAPSGNYAFTDETVHWDGTVMAGESLAISFGAKVNSSAAIGELVNAAAIGYGGDTITRTATTDVTYHYAYLPFLSQKLCITSIHGYVTLQGTPAAGVPLELRYYDGATWSTRATLSTGADGSYNFRNMPALGSQQEYYVRYQNTAGTAGRLWIWGTRLLTTYGLCSNVDMGSFDVADIALVSPDSGAQVYLPYSFQWAPRPATPSDSYEFDLYDANNDSLYFYTPELGYVGSYVLSCLPAGFATQTYYLWDVWVYSPDGGYGIAYWSYWVGFASGPSCTTAAAQSDANQHQPRPGDLPDVENRPRP